MPPRSPYQPTGTVAAIWASPTGPVDVWAIQCPQGETWVTQTPDGDVQYTYPYWLITVQTTMVQWVVTGDTLTFEETP